MNFQRALACIVGRMPSEKCSVYVLVSDSQPQRYDTGLTSDVTSRFIAHNAGHCTHTATGRPWRVDIVLQFPDERRAVRFERYLKSGSGCAFAGTSMARNHDHA